MFFFEKKNQKTVGLWGSPFGTVRPTAAPQSLADASLMGLPPSLYACNWRSLGMLELRSPFWS
jgi:hypothetical protein